MKNTDKKDITVNYSKSISLGTLYNLLSKILYTSVILILANICGPTEFGKISILMVFIGIGQLLSEYGLTLEIINKKEIDSRLVNAVYWRNALSHLIIVIIFNIIASPIGNLWEERQITEMIQLSSIHFIIAPLFAIPMALAKRNLELSRIHLNSCISYLIAGILTIFAYQKTENINTVTLFFVLPSLINYILFHYQSPYKPQKISFTIEDGTSYLSINYIIIRIIQFIFQKTDDFFIGLFKSIQAAGVYNLAYNIILLPRSILNSQLNAILLTTLSKVGDDSTLLNRIQKSLTIINSIIYFTLILNILLFSKLLVTTFLSPSWHDGDLISIINYLSLGLLAYSFGLPGVYFLALKKDRLLVRLNTILYTPFIIIAILFIYFFSIQIVSLYISFVIIVHTAILYIYLHYHLNISIKTTLRQWFEILILFIPLALMCFLIFNYVNLPIYILVLFIIISQSLILIKYLIPKIKYNISNIKRILHDIQTTS